MLTPERFLEIKASGMLPSPQGAALKVIELCGRAMTCRCRNCCASCKPTRR